LTIWVDHSGEIVDGAVFAGQIAPVCQNDGPENGVLFSKQDGPDAERGKPDKGRKLHGGTSFWLFSIVP